MPAPVTTVDVLQQYLIGVLGRAEHHANHVDEVVLTIAGALVWRKDPTPIEVLTREGDMKNVLWFYVNGNRYSLLYAHDTGTIEMRRGSSQGNVVAAFSNATTPAQVVAAFDGL